MVSRSLRAAAAAASFAASGFAPAAADEPPAVVIGAPLVAPPWSASLFIQETARFLEWKLPERRFILRWVPADSIEAEFRDGTLDLAILPSGPVSAADEKRYRPLASMASREAPNPDSGAACAIVVKNGSMVRKAAEAAGLDAVSSSPGSVPGYLACLAELQAAGIDPDRYARDHVRFLGPLKEREALREVLQGKADAAFVRAGLIEDIRAASGEDPAAAGLRVLASRNDSLALLHTSRPYPGPTLLASSGLPPALVREILAAVLAKPADPWGQKWTAPANLSEMNALTKPLRIGPYEHLRSWTLERIWHEYWPFVAAALLALLALIAHGKRADALVRRRTRQLTEAFAKQRRAESLAREKARRVEALERKAIVGQLSGIFAHEISSPVAAAQNLAHGLRKSIDNALDNEESGDPDRLEAIERQLALIEENIARAGGIVDKVRSYAKGRAAKRAPVDLALLAQGVAGTARVSAQVAAIVEGEGPFAVTGDPLELELVIRNLVKNGTEACRGPEPALVRVRVKREGGRVAIEVTDSGPALTDAALENIRSSDRVSTKKDGLGMGLGIAATIIEKHGGSIRFGRGDPSGLRVTALLPAAGEDNNGQTARPGG